MLHVWRAAVPSKEAESGDVADPLPTVRRIENRPLGGTGGLFVMPRVGYGMIGPAWRRPISGSGDHGLEGACLAFDPAFEALRLATRQGLEVAGDAGKSAMGDGGID